MGGHEDNYCASLVFCFMSTLDYGLRNRGGVGDLMTRISFKRNTGRYMGRFFYDVTFFLLIVIIMIDMVFGIIIESFQELCNEDQKHENDKKSHCFICHVNRATVEKNRHNFNEHREKTHNLWNYVNYMISLKFADLHDLNAINSYAREKMDNKNSKSFELDFIIYKKGHIIPIEVKCGKESVNAAKQKLLENLPKETG